MRRLSARTSGTIIAVAGLVLAAVHLQSAVSLRASPGVVLIEAVVPLVLALAVAGVGVLLRGGRLAPPASAERVLGWLRGVVAAVVCVGTVGAARTPGQRRAGDERRGLDQ
jgi:nitroreductase